MRKNYTLMLAAFIFVAASCTKHESDIIQSQKKSTRLTTQALPCSNVVWVKEIAGIPDSTYADILNLGVDNEGNVIYFGKPMYGPSDLDPGPGVLKSNGTHFFSKLNASGNLVWAKSVTSSSQVAWDNNFNYYVTTNDSKTHKFNKSGAEVWAKPFLFKSGINGNLYNATWLSSYPDPVQYPDGSFLVEKYDSDGNSKLRLHVPLIKSGGAVFVLLSVIERAFADEAENIYVLGKKKESKISLRKYDKTGTLLYDTEVLDASFDEWGQEDCNLLPILDRSGNCILSFHGKIAKVTPTGTLAWVKNSSYVGGAYEAAFTDQRGNYYGVISGHFTKFDQNGNGVGYTDLLAPGIRPESFATDNKGNIYIAGSYYGNVDFDPGPGVLKPQASQGAFIMKMNTCLIF